MRNPYFDVLKFVAILMVVYGHVAGAFECAFGKPYVSNFIIGMNMPLFFAISGFFSARTIANGDWMKIGKHIYGYFWPIAFVSVVFAMLSVMFHVPGSEKGFWGYAGRRFLFSPWFLWCLTICYIMTFLCCLPRSRIKKVVAFILLIVGLPFIKGMWHAENVRAMLPFYLFGAFVLKRWEVWRDWRWGVPCLVVYLIVVVFQGNIWSNGLCFYNADTTWRAFVQDGRCFLFYVERIVNGAVGCVGVMWLLKVLCEKCLAVARLAPLGMTTLWVYILHQWLLDRVAGSGLQMTSVWSVCMWTILLFGVTHLCGVGVHFLIERSLLSCVGVKTK